MALPKLNTPKYNLKLPSDGRVVNFRPLVKKKNFSDGNRNGWTRGFV